MSALAAALLMAACTTRNDVRSMPSDSGVRAEYGADLDRTRLAARDALGEMRFTIRDDESLAPHLWRILATHGLNDGTLGRIARIMIDHQGSRAMVHVVVESKLETDAARAEESALAQDLQKRIAARLSK